MIDTQYPLSDHEIETAWRHLPGSITQKVLHNEIVALIQSDRNQLETATPQRVMELQQHLIACRSLLAVLHRRDPKTKNQTP